MVDQPADADVRLTAADAHELADLLVFLHEWLTGSADSDGLAASLDRFPESAGTNTGPAVQLALSRFASLLTASASEVDF